MYSTAERIKAKIVLNQPLTPKEYAFAILYLNLDPTTYSFKKKENKPKKAKMSKNK